MSTTRSTLGDELHECNERIDAKLSKIGMSVKTFKLIKALTQLLGAGIGFYAMTQGADPLITYSLVAFVIGGPEAIDYLLSQQQ